MQHGAVRVYAIDVGYGQLASRLRADPRVVVIERTNVRHLASLPEPVDLVTIDVSFIGLELVLPTARNLLTERGQIVALIKPQFEAGRENVGRGGVVRDFQAGWISSGPPPRFLATRFGDASRSRARDAGKR